MMRPYLLSYSRDPWAGPLYGDRLNDAWQQVVGSGRLILLSHRGPWEHVRNGQGTLERRRGDGGLVTALSTVAGYGPVTWVAAPSGPEDANSGDHDNLGQVALRWVPLGEEAHRLHYEVFSNPILWFVQHGMAEILDQSRLNGQAENAWDRGYVPVNRAFGLAAVIALRGGETSTTIMIHDYHLYLAPSYIRRGAPEALLQFFLHIPWPAPEGWAFITPGIVREICQGLMACDIVGFQTPADAANFLATCLCYVPRCAVDWDAGKVQFNGRETWARPYPISVDVEAIGRIQNSAEAASLKTEIRRLCPGQIILRVDRMDPSKNITTGFRAYERLLQRRPDLLGQVHFLALLVPSRSQISEYARYANEVFSLIEEINGRFGTEDWQPIVLRYENNRTQAMAAMALYDVLLVNSLADGMNLVAKEGPVANTADGVLVLSREAGAYLQLREGALGIEPTDVEGTYRALETALAMSPEERSARARFLKFRIQRSDLWAWLESQLADLAGLRQAQRAVGPCWCGKDQTRPSEVGIGPPSLGGK